MSTTSDRPLLLLRSSWQSVNIGDIAHTPGLLRVLQRFFPEAETVLWPCHLGHGAGEMLLRHFPALRIVTGTLDAEGRPVESGLRSAWESADFFLHGSGPALVDYVSAAAWKRTTGKPLGFFGVTVENPKPGRVEAASGADFVLTRETASPAHLERAGLRGVPVEFCPDATFACDLRDDALGDASLMEASLREKQFVCMVPRLRYTPRHRVYNIPRTEDDLHRDAVNERFAEEDHAKMREAIIRIVRETDLDIYLCPEMTYQLDIMDALLFDPLPEEVKPRVKVRRRYWLPDEAAAVYARAAGVVSFECHSPILALRQETPVVHLRQPTDTIKGQMWRDVGLAPWLLEIEEVSGHDIAGVLLKQVSDREASRKALKNALKTADAALEKGARRIEAACTSAVASRGDF